MQAFIGFREALALTLSNVSVAESETLPLNELTGKILSEDIVARVDCPSISTSRKDGFAVIATDLTEAGKKNPVTLNIIGSIAAGGASHLKIAKGQTVRITTGAPLPDGADAILSEEFCRQENGKIIAFNTAEVGRNILQQGSDIRQGEMLAGKGERLTPPLIGLLAASGWDTAPVYKHPKVAVIATGDEVVIPGEPLPKGKLYASNMIEICSWLSLMGLDYTTELVPDSRTDIEHAVIKHLPHADVFLTSGGAWGRT